MKRVKTMVSLLLAVCLLAGIAPIARADSVMTVSQEMVDVLKLMEGFAEKPYWDYKQWTVGYGTECPEEKRAEYEANGIPLAEAEALLRKELDSFEADVRRFMDNYELDLQQHEFDALVSFSYNCGSSWMNDPTWYMNVAVREGYRGSDFLYAIVLYSKAGGEYLLQDRRLCEANMYLNGVYRAYNSGSDAIPENFRYVLLDGNGGTVRYGICGYDAAQPTGIQADFTAIPNGTKPDGTAYPYTFAGWYTADGTKVEQLDETLPRGTVLYGKWTDYQGTEVCLVKGTSVSMEVTVTAESAAIHTGPALLYQKQTEVAKDTKLQLTEVYQGWGKTQDGWVKLSDTDYTAVPVEVRMGTVTGTKVNYRTGPSTVNTQIMGQKYQGDRIAIVKIDYSQDPAWGQMDNGYWIRLDFVQLDTANTPDTPDTPDEPDEPEPEPVLKGDLTGDDKINSLDGLLLLRYLNGWDVSVQSPEAMDVNADGKVNSLDGLLLLRYLNGWNVTLK